MRKIAILSGLLGVAFIFATASPSLEGYVETLNGAKSLKAEYTVNVIGGSTRTFNVELSKPNMARIDKPNELIVADGQSILTYDKKAKTYYKRPQTEAEFNSMFREDELSIFAPFFNSKSYAAIKTTDGGVKNRKGMSLRVFNGTMDKGRKTANFYIDDKNIARQIELVYTDKDVRWLIDTKSVTVGTDELAANMFAFKAPEGSRELTADEMNTGKWFHNFDEAIKVSKATGKVIMIDFYTTWCGPCKQMAAEAFTSEPFLERAKDFVLCKLDAEVETGLAAQYGIRAYPTVVFVNSEGKKVHEFVGYGGINQVCNDMDKAKGMK
jgi:outer membrane lipoprotein-sorting protein